MWEVVILFVQILCRLFFVIEFVFSRISFGMPVLPVFRTPGPLVLRRRRGRKGREVLREG